MTKNFKQAKLFILEQYLKVFEDKFGICEDTFQAVGPIGYKLFEAEYKRQGAQAYKTSIIQPIRNLWYMSTTIENRWDRLQHFPLKPPILDWGCGIGYTLAWIAELLEVEGLYGWEPEGPQQEILREYGLRFGLDFWDGPPTKFQTVLCLNVLEHMPNPHLTLSHLRSLLVPGGQLIANCDLHDRDSHDAPFQARIEVNESLEKEGQHLSGSDWRKQLERMSL